jgi:hypothetical protein
MESNLAKFFIGFLLLEQFLKNLSGAQKELYFAGHKTLQPCPGGVAGYDHYITLAEVRDGRCYYWRIHVGSNSFFGEMLLSGDDPEEINERAQSLKELIRADILAQIPNKRIIDGAVVSFPKELKAVHGNLESYRFDKQSNLYVKTESEQLANVS